MNTNHFEKNEVFSSKFWCWGAVVSPPCLSSFFPGVSASRLSGPGFSWGGGLTLPGSSSLGLLPDWTGPGLALGRGALCLGSPPAHAGAVWRSVVLCGSVSAAAPTSSQRPVTCLYTPKHTSRFTHTCTSLHTHTSSLRVHICSRSHTYLRSHKYLKLHYSTHLLEIKSSFFQGEKCQLSSGPFVFYTLLEFTETR